MTITMTKAEYLAARQHFMQVVAEHMAKKLDQQFTQPEDVKEHAEALAVSLQLVDTICDKDQSEP